MSIFRNIVKALIHVLELKLEPYLRLRVLSLTDKKCILNTYCTHTINTFKTHQIIFKCQNMSTYVVAPSPIQLSYHNTNVEEVGFQLNSLNCYLF